MMTYDQIKDIYAAYLRTRDVKDTVEWMKAKGVNEDDARRQGQGSRFNEDVGRTGEGIPVV